MLDLVWTIRFKNIIKAIASVVGYKGTFQYDTSKPVGMKQKLMDDSGLNGFGWRPKISLKGRAY